MCQSQAQGGLRCASNTKPAFDSLFQEALNAESLGNNQLLAIQEATALYASTPSGASLVAKLTEPLWATSPVLASSLEIAIKIGTKNREIALDVARLTRLQLEKSGLVALIEEETENCQGPILAKDQSKSAPSQKFDADAWLATHPIEGKMGDLWHVLICEANDDGRHETRDLLKSITEADLATYIVAKEAHDMESLTEAIATRAGLPSEDVLNYLQKASKRQSGAHFNSDKIDLLKKMQRFAEENGVEPAWVLRQATRENIEWAAISLKKSATKRSRFESVAAAFVRSRTDRPTLQLSQAGNSLSLRFSSTGEIAISTSKNEGHSKSADLAIIIETEGKVKVVLAGHKFARVSGGGQDNQWNDATTYLNNGLIASNRHKDIPELRTLVSKALGRELSPEEFIWEPALILDGEYFTKAPKKMREDLKRPLLASSNAFIGDIDTFVAQYQSDKIVVAQ